MAKLGVGIGDEFPIDEPKQPEHADPAARAEYERKREEWRKARAEWRRRREEWRAKRRELREEWHRQREEFRAEMCRRFSEHPERPTGGDHHEDGSVNVMLVVAVLALAAIVLVAADMVASHLYLVIGALVLGSLYLAWRSGSDHFDFHHFNEPPRLLPPAQRSA